MFAGFDYGTSNCAIGIMQESNGANRARLLPIDRGKAFMPSVLYALERELICESVGQNISDSAEQSSYIDLRVNALAQAQRVRREENIRANTQTVFLGSEAFTQYLDSPGEGYFVKSPKSFLGASGLRPEFVQFFEDIVTAMMQDIKQRAELELDDVINHTVIGRPVNFQGIDAEESNRQAIDILSISAKRAGFKTVEFLYEPLAAGLDFEASLTEEKVVLVVDIGGGTTDCAMVLMGPGRREKNERSVDFLGHSGERVGGNDMDIQLAAKALMPLFGMNSKLKNGLPMPTQAFWDAVSTNDVGAQATFNSQRTSLSLQQLLIDTCEPELLRRFINLREEKQNYQLVRSAELVKIALSDQPQKELLLDYIEAGLSCEILQQQFSQAIERPLAKVMSLIDTAVQQADCSPDLIYLTGGSAKSPVIRAAIEHKLGAVKVVDGDHFGSVAAGLTVWAQHLFR